MSGRQTEKKKDQRRRECCANLTPWSRRNSRTRRGEEGVMGVAFLLAKLDSSLRRAGAAEKESRKPKGASDGAEA